MVPLSLLQIHEYVGKEQPGAVTWTTLKHHAEVENIPVQTRQIGMTSFNEKTFRGNPKRPLINNWIKIINNRAKLSLEWK